MPWEVDQIPSTPTVHLVHYLIEVAEVLGHVPEAVELLAVARAVLVEDQVTVVQVRVLLLGTDDLAIVKRV